jgi:Reverse transcriptase (RNA-dependent DNA polymerase)
MSHSVVWLHKLFHQHMKTKSALITGFNTYDINPVTNNTQPVQPAVALTIAYPSKEPGEDPEIMGDDVEFCNAHLPEYDSNPQSAAQALLSKKSKHWWKAMITEFLNCEEKKVWVIVPKSKVPKGRKIIGNRWVYAEKDDGTYRSRTVAKGFSQVPGKDFQEHHSPIVHDNTFHVVLVQKLVYNLISRQFDIVTAFLYGLLDEEIYMEFPEGHEKFLKEHYGKK